MNESCDMHGCALELDGLRGLVCPACDAALHREMAARWGRWRWLVIVYAIGVAAYLLRA